MRNGSGAAVGAGAISFCRHGGEGIRTPVRLQIPRYVYVRIPLFQSRPNVGQQTASNGPVVEVLAAGVTTPPSSQPELFDARRPASGELITGQVQQSA
jgi:hypothetical protein